eukprot:COSAG06_NODE_1901_length_8109_cov_4.896879_4_plen_460_part_00
MGGAASAAAAAALEDEEDGGLPAPSQPPSQPPRRRRRKRGEKSVPVVAEETGRGGYIPIEFGDKLLRIDGGMGKCRVRVVDMQHQHQVRQFGDPEKSVMAMIAVSEKRLVVRYQNDSTLECFDIAKGASVWAVRVGELSKPCEVTKLVLLPSGDVVAGTDVGNVARVDKNGRLRGAKLKFEGYGGVSALLVEPDEVTVRGVVPGTSVLVGTCTGELAWVGEDGAVRGERQHLEGRIEILKAVPGTRTVVVGTHAGGIVRVDFDGVQASPLTQMDGSIVSMALAPSAGGGGGGDARVLVGTYKGQVAWVDAEGFVSPDPPRQVQLFASVVKLAVASVVKQKRGGRKSGSDAPTVVAVCGTDDGKVLWLGEDGGAAAALDGEVVKLNGRITALEFAPELCGGYDQIIVGTADGEMAYVSKGGPAGSAIVGGKKKGVVKFGGRIDAVMPSRDGVRAIWLFDF